MVADVRVYPYRRTFAPPFPYFGRPVQGKLGHFFCRRRATEDAWTWVDLPVLPNQPQGLSDMLHTLDGEHWEGDFPSTHPSFSYADSLSRAIENLPQMMVELPVSALVLGEDPHLEATLSRRLDEGYRTFKMKIGSGFSPEILDHIPAMAGVQYRLDPNRSWDPETLVRSHEHLLRRGVVPAYYEDPCPDWKAVLATGIPLALDESLSTTVLEHFEEAGLPQGIRAFIHKGGRLCSWEGEERLYRVAGLHHIPVVFSHNLESEIGTMGQLALHLNRLRDDAPLEAVGLDSLRFLSNLDPGLFQPAPTIRLDTASLSIPTAKLPTGNYFTP